MIKDFHVMNLKCDGKHLIRPKLHVVGKDRAACKLYASKVMDWKFHRGKDAGKVSCPKCARPRSVFQEFPGEHQ